MSKRVNKDLLGVAFRTFNQLKMNFFMMVTSNRIQLIVRHLLVNQVVKKNVPQLVLDTRYWQRVKKEDADGRYIHLLIN